MGANNQIQPVHALSGWLQPTLVVLVFNRPGVAGAVLQTALSLINLID